MRSLFILTILLNSAVAGTPVAYASDSSYYSQQIAYYCQAPGRRGDGRVFCCDWRAPTGARTAGAFSACKKACGPRLKPGRCIEYFTDDQCTQDKREKMIDKINRESALLGAYSTPGLIDIARKEHFSKEQYDNAAGEVARYAHYQDWGAADWENWWANEELMSRILSSRADWGSGTEASTGPSGEISDMEQLFSDTLDAGLPVAYFESVYLHEQEHKRQSREMPERYNSNDPADWSEMERRAYCVGIQRLFQYLEDCGYMDSDLAQRKEVFDRVCTFVD